MTNRYSQLLTVIAGIIISALIIFSSYRLILYIQWGLSDAYTVNATVTGFRWQRQIILEWYDEDTCYRTKTDSDGNEYRERYDCSEWRVRDRYTANGDSKELYWPKYPEPGYRERIKQRETYWITGLSNDKYNDYPVGFNEWKMIKKGDKFRVVYNNFGSVARLEF